LKAVEPHGGVSITDEPLSIVAMDNSEDQPYEKSERCHTKGDEIVS
jgi:hypothetical protein